MCIALEADLSKKSDLASRRGVEIDLRTADWPKKVSLITSLKSGWICWRMPEFFDVLEDWAWLQTR